MRLIPEWSTRKVARELPTKPRARDNFVNKVYRRVRFRSYGTVGYGPTRWVKSWKGGDVLRDHVNKACQRIACLLCRQQHRYQGRGTKRTIFLLVETRRTIRQGSRPSVVTGMSSTIVIWSYLQSGTTRCLHKQGNITAYII